MAKNGAIEAAVAGLEAEVEAKRTAAPPPAVADHGLPPLPGE